MPARLRWLLSRLDANYWFYPALFSLFSAALAFALVYADRNGFAEWLNDVGWIVLARPASASNMLTVIAGSMIGVASTVFSITIAAVAYASGTYGPRLLTNFMEDKGNQISLATFIGTFVYALTVLRTVRAEDEVAANLADAAATSLPGFVPQLSLLVAYGLMALSVAVLVYFLNHVPSSIRINSVLKEIGARLIDDIGKNYPEGDGEDPARDRLGGASIASTRTGYIQIIDFAALGRLCERHDIEIELVVRTGDFVHRGMPLATISSDNPDQSIPADIEEAFTVGSTRTPTQDPRFLIDELVEIAMRALSPGINDPFTAITATHWLGAATAELARRDLADRRDEESGGCRVRGKRETFELLLRRGFGTMRGAVATSKPVSLVVLDTLLSASARATSPERAALLRAEADLLLAQAREALSGPDLAEVAARHAQCMAAMRV